MGSEKNKYVLYALMIWFLGTLFFFLEYLLRVSPSVIYPQLMDKFTVGAAAMGALSSFFYYPYILMQIPVGVITDRFGPRKVMTLAAFGAVLACLFFAVSTHITLAIIARALMGFCAAFAFVGTLRIAINWFDVKHFALLAGLTQAAGMLGAAVGDAPFSLYVRHFGVDTAMYSIAVLFLVLTILMALMVRNTPTTDNAGLKAAKHSIRANLKEVLRTPALWINCLYIGCLYAPTTVLAESWGVNFTEAFRKLSATDAAFLVSMIFVGLIIGCPLFGQIAHKVKTITLMKISAAVCLLLCFIIVYVPSLSKQELVTIYFAYGIFNAGIIPSYKEASILVRKSLSGTALGLTNMASVFIGSLIIQGIGILLAQYGVKVRLIEGHTFTAASYQYFFSILIVSFAVSLILSLFFYKKVQHYS